MRMFQMRNFTEDDVRKILTEAKAVVVNSHFVYKAGDHGSAYVNKDALFPNTTYNRMIGLALAERFDGEEIEAVIGPVVGGVIVSQWTAEAFSEIRKQHVLSVFAEDVGGRLVVKRGYDLLIKGKKVLVVEDILNTGGSAGKTVVAAREAGAEVVGVGAICNRGGVTKAMLGDVPRLEVLLDAPLDKWSARDCPLCLDKVPINTELGHGREFLEKLKAAGENPPKGYEPQG